MSKRITKALLVSLLAMVSAVAFECTKQTIRFHLPLWGSHVHTILFITISTFVVSIVMLRREEKSRAVLEVRLQEIDHLRLLIEHSRDGILIIEPRSSRVLDANKAQAAMLGYTPEEMRQLCVWDIEAQYTSKQFLAAFPRLKTESPLFETKHRRKDGTTYDAEVSVSLANVGGRSLAFCITRDISARKAVERALRESEENLRHSEAKLRSFVDKSPFGIFQSSVDEDRFIGANPALLKMLGYTSEKEILSLRISKDVYSDPQDRIKTHAQLLRDGVVDVEASCKRKDGTVYTAHLSGRLIQESPTSGRVFEAMVEDVTERKRAEQQLRESEMRFRHAVEGAPVGMYIQSDGILRYFNPAALAMFGAESASQIVGRGFLEIIHPDTRAAVCERARLVNEKREPVPFLEERLLRLDGTVFDGEVTAIPFVFEGRSGALVFVRDITERKRQEAERNVLEHRLQQAQKMEVIGRLAGGIAHDFNNLLMVIQSYTEMMQDDLPAGDRLRKNTEQVLKAAKRATSLTSHMLAFSRKQIATPVVIDLNAVIHETVKMLRRLIGEDIELRVDPADSLWTISADSDQIVQVLLNLCVNSRDAMPQGGILTIATENITVGKVGIVAHPCVAPGEYVKLSVTDTGMGISREEQEQIFEPFYTTKEVGKGTGLGLAMVYGVVKQCDGYVWVESERGMGACFTICLPRAKGKVVCDASAKSDLQPGGTETVLVAEDEEALREAMGAYLRTLGYTVLAASSGPHALSVAADHKGHIDLLISDIVMPKMSGRELSQMLKSLRPDLKTIYMSGHNDDAVLRHGIQHKDVTFLQKPFNLSTLARTVRETLGPTVLVQ